MRRLPALLLAVAVVTTTAAVTATPASASARAIVKPTGTEEFLFTVQAAQGATAPLPVTGPEDERFTLTLSGVDPVTMFSDRPYRDARLISPNALDANWDAWFSNDPPNAVLTYARPGQAPASMVVRLTDPTFDRATRTLSFTAAREAREHDPVETGPNWQKRTTPTSMRSVSLFIDSTSATCPLIAPTIQHLPRLLCGLV